MTTTRDAPRSARAILPWPRAQALEERFCELFEEGRDGECDKAEELTGGPSGGVKGPFVAILRGPELVDRLGRVGEYLRLDKPTSGVTSANSCHKRRALSRAIISSRTMGHLRSDQHRQRNQHVSHAVTPTPHPATNRGQGKKKDPSEVRAHRAIGDWTLRSSVCSVFLPSERVAGKRRLSSARRTRRKVTGGSDATLGVDGHKYN
jgi:hypothetical protein